MTAQYYSLHFLMQDKLLQMPSCLCFSYIHIQYLCPLKLLFAIHTLSSYALHSSLLFDLYPLILQGAEYLLGLDEYPYLLMVQMKIKALTPCQEALSTAWNKVLMNRFLSQLCLLSPAPQKMDQNGTRSYLSLLTEMALIQLCKCYFCYLITVCDCFSI